MNKLLIIILLLLVGCNSKFQMNDRDKTIDHMIIEFCITLEPKGKFYLVGLGGGLNHDVGKYNKIDVVLETEERVKNVEEARIMLVGLLCEFLDFINKKENIREYLAVFPFTIENVHVSILCKNSIRPNISGMFNCKKFLYYYTKGDTYDGIPSEELLEETFEEAQQILSKNSKVKQPIN